MRQKLWFFIFVTMVLFIGNKAMSQISEKGVPASFSFDDANVLRAAKFPFVTPIKFDVGKLKAEDKVFEENNLPLRTATIIPVDLDVNNSGEWTTLPNGQQIWRLTIDAPGAIAMLLYYDDFYIPEGGKLFVYNEDRTHVIGAYTYLTNPHNGGAFSTEYVAGDKITLEYNVPLSATNSLLMGNTIPNKPEMPRIKISGVGYGYNYLKINMIRGGGDFLRIGESESCQVNINCPEGDNWQTHKKGVAKTLTPIGSYVWMCSGTLVNNTRQDMTPYFLTASHCFYDNSNAQPTANGWNQIQYYFHYESPGCETAQPAATRTVVGAQMLVELRLNGSSDGALLKINGTIPLEWDLYFNGWDRTNTPATSGVSIHHPQGDIKKISTFTTAATSATANMSGGEIGATNAHWLIYFAQTQSGWGQTEGGSSGSPMFNQNGLVVGTLTGGNSSCSNPTGRNIYGKLWYHWDHANQATASTADVSKLMKNYLDPDDTGVERINGTYTVNNEAVADFTASSTDIYVLESITYTDHSVGANTWNWTFEGGSPSTWVGRTPPPVVYNAAGDFVTTLVANDGTGPQETKTVNIHVAIKGMPEQPVANFELPALVFSEGFDSPTMSSDWVVENGPTQTITNRWMLGNITPNFNTIDPLSVTSAVINWNAAKIDSWLKTTNSYPIISSSFIEFYAEYSGSYLANATINFLVSDDNGATWKQIWTAGNVNISRSMSWTRYSFDLSEYAGKDLMFAWQYVGTDGDSAGLDGIKLFEGDFETTINVGDFLTPIDLSTGTPVLWDWTFEGATPSKATGQAPRVQYMTAGKYDITLKVTNTLGTDSKTITGAVTVVDRPSVVNFVAASKGYTMQENYGPYIIPHSKVDFTDKTQNYPLSWNWTLNGGNPANSTEQNPKGVLYDASGIYDVVLQVSNTAGPVTKSVPGFVKAGFNDPTRIWNMLIGESITLPSATYNGNTAAFFGSNVYGGTMFSERFDAPMTAGYISKIDIKCLRSSSATNSGNMAVAIYSDNNGVPGTLIGTSVNVAMSSIPVATSITGLAYTTVTFPTPILVSGAFHVRISGLNSTGSGNTTRYVYIAAAASRGELAKNTAYIYNSNAWRPASSVITNFNTSMDIVPHFAYSNNTISNFVAEQPYYELKSNNNPYIPTGAALNFTDLSTGLTPNAWDWTFPGGDPATSTEQNPQVTYITDGTHNVSLSVSNSEGGSGSATKTNYIKSIYNEYNTIWNLLSGEAGSSVYTVATGHYISGPNSYTFTDFAERFDAPITGGKISKVDVLFYRTGTPSGTLTITIAKDEGGIPGEVLAVKTLAANTTNFPTNNVTRLTTITFDEPAFVSGAYFVVISGYTGIATGGVRGIMICSALDRGEGGKSTFHLTYRGNWYRIDEIYDLNTSLNIAPYFAYSNEIEADFTAENGYTRQLNYGQFIPTNASLSFIDKSIGVATAWDWTFAGGTPSTSNDANPQVSYTAAGEFAVKLKTTNLAKVSSETEVANYVKAGYDTPDKIWNMIPGETGEKIWADGTDLLTGANRFGDIAFAERFDAPLASGYISSTDILFTNNGSNGTLTVSIQKEVGGEPGQLLASKTLSVSDISNTGYTTVSFDNPAYTDGAFYVVVSGFDQLTVSSIAIGIGSSNILPASAKNTAFVFDADNIWSPLLESWGIYNSLSLNIVPTFTYFVPVFDVTADFAVDRKNIDATKATATVTSSAPWTATSTAGWITITNGSGASDGTFTYTVADNTTPYPRAAKIVVAPTGLELLQKVIIVRQASTNPTGLTAEFEDDDIRVDWDALVLSAPANVQLSAASNSKATPLIVRSVSDELRASIPMHFGSKTALRYNNLHSKSNRQFMLADTEDIENTVVREALADQKITPNIAKSSLRSTPAETVIRWGTGNNYDAIGFSNTSLRNYKLEVAALFATTDMTIPSGISSIKQVEIYIQNLPLDGITLKIRQGNILYQQKVSNAQLTASSFNKIALTAPFMLDNNSDTYIGYEFSIDGGMFVAGIDEGPAVVGKGDLISEQGGAFFSLYEATGGVIKGNWNIAALVETGRLDNYILYRDGTAIAQPTEPTYLDTETLTAGEYCYQVTAVYGGLESTMSNKDCVINISDLNTIFTPSPDELQLPGSGGTQSITLKINDPDDLITRMGFTFHVVAPNWINRTMSGNVITFRANPNTTGVVRTGVIKIWLGDAGSKFSTENGYEIPVIQKSMLTLEMLDYDMADAIYNGTAIPASVSLNSAYSGLGNITILYNGFNAAVNAGTYKVSINAAEGFNFDKVTNLAIDNFTIYPAELTIRTDDASRPYGTANPEFTFTFTGLKSNDSQEDFGNIKATTTATISSLPGNYPITITGAENSNYTITYQEGTLTIGKLNQSITFQDISMIEIGKVFYINASASSGLAITYTGSDPEIATVNSYGMITAIKEGTVTITMLQAGNNIYNPVELAHEFVMANFTAIDPIANQAVTVYPNPATKSAPVYVSADIDESLLAGAVITIYDASGSLVKNVQVTGKLTKVDLPVSSGTYFLTLKGKDGFIKNLKVIVK